MKRILLIYLPFCTPASPPYSLTNLYSFIKANSKHKIDVLDLNLEFHKLKFPKFHKYYKKGAWKDYAEVTADFNKLTSKVYSDNNKKVVEGKKPELLNKLIKKIKDKKPDIVAFSIVYSSQAFYANAIMKELDCKCVIGGPAVNDKLKKIADKTLINELEFLEYIDEKKVEHDKLNFNYIIDFSSYKLNNYFSPCPVIPIKTSNTCYYKKCAFCSHFVNIPYYEYNLNTIKKTILASKQKHFFLIDDMIHVKRLLEIAEMLKPLKVKWTAQLKPTKDFTLDVFKKLKKSGLNMIMWGIESGSDRILKLINKGTNIKDITKVLEDSKKAGIVNINYMLYGFPTETKEEFIETMDFLKENEKNIDLVSSSIFGLQKNTIIYNNPKKFGIIKINEEQRTVLEPKITYEVKTGLNQKEASKLRDKYKKTINKINKYPKDMNYFREHMLCKIK
ncbi:radical SAM protein [Candidatus Woesearchaeota archaeon]|nr:radical SAM protein [Candidatus Woesearchaeota archaeon]